MKIAMPNSSLEIMVNASSIQEKESDLFYNLSGIYLILVGIIGGIFNLVALMKAIKAIKTELNFVLTNLIVNDLFIVFIGVPLDTMGAFTKGQALDYVPCQATAFIHTIFGMGSLYTITAMAGIRYKSVVQFERWWHMLTIGTYFSSNYVRIIWSFSLLIAVPPLVGIGKYVIDIGMVSCAPNWTAIDGIELLYNSYLMVFGFFVPTIVIFVSNMSVMYLSWKQSQQNITRRQNTMIYQGPVTKEENKRDQGTTLNTIMKKQQKMQRRVTILASSMTISFYITWMPYAIDCILSMSGIKIAHATNVYAILFAKTGTVVNPILYIFLNKDITRSYSQSTTSI